jgi:dTDP-4-dehydrorhamnose 3,5-epimerase
MEVIELDLPGLKLIRPKIHRDERGFFFESYHQLRYQAAGIDPLFVQDNASFSKEGTLRGLHFQSTPGQAKLVSVSFGKIWDVAVDLRPGSPAYGKWQAVELSGETGEQLFIPVGFAHGFLALVPSRVHYKVSQPYNGETECSIRYNDPDLAIAWPIENPLLSLRDQQAPFLRGYS